MRCTWRKEGVGSERPAALAASVSACGHWHVLTRLLRASGIRRTAFSTFCLLRLTTVRFDQSQQGGGVRRSEGGGGERGRKMKDRSNKEDGGHVKFDCHVFLLGFFSSFFFLLLFSFPSLKFQTRCHSSEVKEFFPCSRNLTLSLFKAAIRLPWRKIELKHRSFDSL